MINDVVWADDLQFFVSTFAQTMLLAIEVTRILRRAGLY